MPKKKTEVRAKGSPVPPAETSLSPRGGAKHRTMKETILESLRPAGAAGKTIDEISREIEVLKSRVQGWFSSTGRKCGQVEKISPGRWRIVE